MAHHQHHGADYEALISRSMESRPASQSATSMAIISEDEVLADTDEPPDPQSRTKFSKHVLTPSLFRRESLLTQALHTDSESHDEASHQTDYFKLSYMSSTASSHSVRSVGDFTSDDGHISPSTRASTPASPRTIMSIPKIRFPSRQNSNLSSTDSHQESDQPPSDEASVEAKLGRKRCIMFACGQKDNTIAPKPQPSVATEAKAPEPAQRSSTIKFACPFKASKSNLGEPARTTTRHLSPAPQKHTNASGTAYSRRHRDSDATIREESPTTPKGTSTSLSTQKPKPRSLSSNSDMRRAEACRFHEFASEEEEHEDWTQESTCHRSRLTVDDTLKKEHDIRKLAEEVDEEEAIEREIEDNLSDEEDDDDDYDLSDDSDDGVKSDDEDGFADSDDEDSDGDYEWWVPRRSAAASPYVGHDVFRPVANRTYSDSSMESDGQASPKSRGRKSGKRALPLNIRPSTPELPDSTDFVCGTLDEDRPQEQAYLLAIAARKASKHKTTPQDIDPTFPISDPETESDDDAKADVQLSKPTKLHEESDHFMHSRPSDDDHQEEIRGRRRGDKSHLMFDVPESLINRRDSPPTGKKSCAGHRSPAPRMLFGSNRSPRRHLTPAPTTRMVSPPPSRRGSTAASPAPAARYGIPFLSNHMNHLTHTASLPRSPHPLLRKRTGSPPPPARTTNDDDESDKDKEEDDDEGSATDRPTDSRRYTRGAIDIAQGLERKRLKRREKFHRQYQRKEEKKERKGEKKRPTPGQGAERMRQIGIECAVYRGTRMLSI